MWDDIANDVANGRPITVRAQSAIRKYVTENPQKYPNEQPKVRNEDGKPGNPNHQGVEEQLAEMAKQEFPNDIILRCKSINGRPGPDGKLIDINRQPEVTVIDRTTNRVKKVYEAARKDRNGGWVQRELDKIADYERLGIPSHFEEVP
jgi:hypothetical protein